MQLNNINQPDKSRQKILIGFFVALVGVLLFTGCSKPKPPEVKALPVFVQEINTETAENSSEFLARLDGRRTVQVMAQTSGRVLAVNVIQGQYIQRGASMAQLDAAKASAHLSSLSEETNASYKQIAQAQSTLKGVAIQLAAAQKDLDLNRTTLERNKSLIAAEAISPQDLDVSINNVEQSIAKVKDLKEQIQTQNDRIAVLKYRASSARFNQQEQAANVRDFIVPAPFTGLIGNVPVKVGQWVNAGDAIATLIDQSSVEVAMSIPMEYAPRLKAGTPLKLESLSGEPIGDATMSFISGAIDGKSQTLEVRGKLEHLNGGVQMGELVRPDQTIRANIIWNTQPAILIPPESKFNLIDQTFVYVVQANPKRKGRRDQWVAHQVPIELGPLQNNRYVVLKGLKPGDQLIVSHIQKLREGMPVTPKQPVQSL